MDGPPITIAMINQKGGVGKTTLCHHLAGAFSKAKKQVLLIDWDPQANLTQGLLGPEATEAILATKTAVRLFNDELPEPEPEELIIPTHIEGVFLLPGSESLEDFDFPRPQDQGEYQTTLREFIREVHGMFDVIMIDCRPTLQLLGWNALAAARYMMTPFPAEDYGSQGIVRVQRVFDRVLASINPDLRLLGYCINIFDRRKAVHKAFDLAVRNLYGSDVFETRIPDRVDIKESTSAHLPVCRYKPRSAATKAFDQLAKEITERDAKSRVQGPEFLYLGNRTQTTTNVDTTQLGKVG